MPASIAGSSCRVCVGRSRGSGWSKPSDDFDAGWLVFGCFERHADRDDGVDVVAPCCFVEAPSSPAVPGDCCGCVLPEFGVVGRLAVASGARRGELLGVTWLGFSAADGTLTISQQVVPARGGLTISPCKTKGSHRTISRDEDTVAALDAHRETQLIETREGRGSVVDRDLIFADALGGPLSPQRLTQWFAALRKDAAIRPGRLHDVRHSHATHLLTRGVPVHVVASRLGHSSPVVTLNVYAHVLPTGEGQAASVIAEILAP